MLAQFWCSKGKSTKHYPPSFTWNQGPVPLEGTQVRCPASAREPNFQLCVCVCIQIGDLKNDDLPCSFYFYRGTKGTRFKTHTQGTHFSPSAFAGAALDPAGGVQFEDLQVEVRPPGHGVCDEVEVHGVVEDVPRGPRA